MAALRIALRDMATRDYLRSELRDLLEELEERGMVPEAADDSDPEAPRAKKAKKKKAAPAPPADPGA